MASVNRYKAILAEVARDLEIEASSELCAHVATLRMVREGIQARILRGERVAVDDVLSLDQALKKYLPERDPLAISVRFVENAQGRYVCKCCGAENLLEHGTYTPVEKPKPVEKPATVDAAPAAPVPPQPSNVVELDLSRLHHGGEGGGMGAVYAPAAGNTAADLWRNDLNPTRSY
jgi:hypothetical protein